MADYLQQLVCGQVSPVLDVLLLPHVFALIFQDMCSSSFWFQKIQMLTGNTNRDSLVICYVHCKKLILIFTLIHWQQVTSNLL